MRKVSPGLTRLTLLVSLGLALPVLAAGTNMVTLQLKNGDRLTGEVLSEDAERVVLSTPWNTAIFVPKTEIQLQVVVVEKPAETGSGAGSPSGENRPPTEVETGQAAGAGAVPEQNPVVLTETPKAAKAPPKAKGPKHWKWSIRMGTDFISGAKDRQIYSGGASATYTRNYKSNPKKFLRNKIEYGLQYGETDGEVSANSMVGANKLDVDMFGDFYGYAAMGAGYDIVRKIDYQYELGPGLGYHLVAEKALAIDTEAGLNYQYREGLDGAPNQTGGQARLAQELTWEVLPKITLKENFAFLPFIEEMGEYQLRAGGNLGFGIVSHLSLNLTVLNLYDTQPAPGVPNNEFQFRSSLGVNF